MANSKRCPAHSAGKMCADLDGGLCHDTDANVRALLGAMRPRRFEPAAVKGMRHMGHLGWPFGATPVSC